MAVTSYGSASYHFIKLAMIIPNVDKLHGIKFHPTNKKIIAINRFHHTKKELNKVVFLNIETGYVLADFVFEYAIKDLAFVTENTFVIATSIYEEKNMQFTIPIGSISDSHSYILDTVNIVETHADGIVS